MQHALISTVMAKNTDADKKEARIFSKKIFTTFRGKRTSRSSPPIRKFFKVTVHL